MCMSRGLFLLFRRLRIEYNPPFIGTFSMNLTEIVQSANECTAASDIHHEFEKEMNSQTKLISMDCSLQLALHTMHTLTTIGLFEAKTMAMTLCDANRDSIFPSFFSLLNHLT